MKELKGLTEAIFDLIHEQSHENSRGDPLSLLDSQPTPREIVVLVEEERGL